MTNIGGTLSTITNNDKLVEYLLDDRFLRRKEIELVFRAVDRANYILPSHQENAYNDLAWKHGNLHLSAPCVYAVAMEYLSLKPGQSFLNIGSGTGYFSTIAGLLLGPYGINHGIELHEDCIQHARNCLDNFKQKSLALEEFEFCEPYFVKGNCLRVIPTREYDSVYCGAAVSENNLTAVKRFVRIGGNIVMPYKGRLCCFTRSTETDWACEKSLAVSFATLVTPDSADQNSFALPKSEPLSLQDLCRSKTRQILRKNIWIEYPELEKRDLSHPNPQPRTETFFDQFDEGLSEDEEEYEDDDDGAEDNEENDDNYDTDGHFIRQTQFLFNMEVVNNETSYPIQRVRRVAMLMRPRTGTTQQSVQQAALNSTIEERTVEVNQNSLEQNGSSSMQDDQIMDVSPSLVSDASNEPEIQRITRDSESESDIDDDYNNKQWRKIPKRENTDSGIVDDVNINLDDVSSSLNVDPSDSETEDDMDVDLSSVTLNETFRRICKNTRLQDAIPTGQSSNENVPTRDTIERDLFIDIMKKKIQLLPLPTKMKLYINHNRNL